MKKTDLKDLRNKDKKALTKLSIEKIVQAQKSRMDIVSGKEKNLKSYSNYRHETAKILTLMRELEIKEKLESKNK